jgi:hypothetical protein
MDVVRSTRPYINAIRKARMKIGLDALRKGESGPFRTAMTASMDQDLSLASPNRHASSAIEKSWSIGNFWRSKEGLLCVNYMEGKKQETLTIL